MKRTSVLIILIFVFSAAVAQRKQAGGLRFTQNKNQWPAQVQYRADLPSGKLFLEKSSFTYLFYDSEKLAQMHNHQHGQGEEEHNESASSLMDFHAFRVSFLNCNPQPIIRQEEESGELRNYFLGNDPGKWASDVKSYSKISYEGIYPYTVLELFQNDDHLKYQYKIGPGGDVSTIRMKYEGADSLYISQGRLIIKTSVNTITEETPYSYQIIRGKKVTVPSAFSLQGNELSFIFPKGFNKNYELVIDPKLIFSTYSGSYGDNWGNTATFDQAGNLYSGGSVFESGFPATFGAYQVNFAGGFNSYGVGVDVGILKYNPTGTSLLYATYLGGSNTEIPHSLVVNENNELLIFGSTSSNNFPVTIGSFDQSFNGGSSTYPMGFGDAVLYQAGSDIFVSKLSTTGSALLASTFIGGSANDGIIYLNGALTKNYGDQLRGEIITDKNNNVYLASSTQSSNFPIVGGFQASHGNAGGHDAVVVKLNPNLSSITWSSFLGGNLHDVAFSIALDSLNNVYVAGGTRSFNFPTTPLSINPSGIGVGDGFVTAIDQSGDSIISSTYLGTSEYDQAYFVQLDTEENVYVFGQTDGTYPVTAGVYSNPNSGQFIHKLTKDMDSTLFSTVIGNGSGAPNISPTAFLVNECGNIFLSGWGGTVNASTDNFGSFTGYIGGNTNNMSVTSDAFRPTTDGSDFYIMALEKNAKSLLYGTYFGENGGVGDHVDGGTSRFDKRGIIYHSVCASCGGSQSFPTTSGAWSGSNNSTNCNNAAFKFDLASLKASFTADTVSGCGPLPIFFTNTSLGGKSFTWTFGDGATFTTSGTGAFSHTFSNPGSYTVMLVAYDLTTCTGSDTALHTINVYTLTPPTAPSSYTICTGDTVQLNAGANPYYTYVWSPANSLSDSTVYNPVSTATTTTYYQVLITDTNNCSLTMHDTVYVAAILKPEYKNETGCRGLPKIAFQNNSQGPLNYLWNFGDGQTSTEASPVHEYASFGTYTAILTSYNNFCSETDTIEFTIPVIKYPNLITPNGDSLNDEYEIEGNPGEWRFEVYNRWGEPVFKSQDYKNNWDASGLVTGVYYYLITTPSKVQCKGWVHVIK
jgi:gliding motility-associated-like protein